MDDEMLTQIGQWTAAAAGLLTAGGVVLKNYLDFRSVQTKDEAARADKAHEGQVKTLEASLHQTNTQLQAVTKEHRDCEKNFAELTGRVCALEERAEECYEDRKALRNELDEIRKGKQ